MNLIKIFQLSALILLEIWVTSIKANQGDCTITPTDADKVDVLVYINGGTRVDELWYSRYCSWKDGGMPYDTYAPVTIKVGGEITCDEDNKCNCSNEDSDHVDCKVTFQHVCAQQILGDDEFKNLLCCSALRKDPDVPGSKGFHECVNERDGLMEQISTCIENQGSGGPQEVALKNAKEVIDAKVDMADNTEPFFFYNGIFDKCISDDSPGWFLQKICLMLKLDIAKSITQCKEAMGWKPENNA